MLIKVIYQNDEAQLVRVMRIAHKNKKRLCDMSAKEIMNTGFGMFR